MKKFYFLILAALLAVSCKPCCEHVRNELRAPAYPLVTIDPFTVHGLQLTDSTTLL